METPFTVCAAVLAVVQDALVTAGRPVGVALVCVGGLVVDDCCAGQLVVAPERTFRTVAPFPTEATGDQACGDTPIGLSIVVRVDRCIPVVDARGRAPTIDVQEAAFADVLHDAAVVWSVVVSDALIGDDGFGDSSWERANVDQIYVGPDGGCIGSETRLILGIPRVDWCGALLS